MDITEMPEEIPLGKAENLTGKHFGKLTPLYRCKPTGKMTTWVCMCDCGEYVPVTASHLKNGHTKSCGCIQSKNLIGKRFGRLTVIGVKRGNHYKSKKEWLCQCDCGKTTYYTAKALKYKTHCPWCDWYKDIKGQKFGKLTAKKKLNKKDSRGNWIWLCDCDCGTKNVEVSSAHLISGNTKSCGCLYSVGEITVKQLLVENKIFFETQKTFSDCLYPDTKGLLRFDFYLPEYNCCIEYDGLLHYETKNCGWNTQENLEETQKRDFFKNDYCHSHNITLKRVPYWDLKNITIEKLLDDTYVI